MDEIEDSQENISFRELNEVKQTENMALNDSECPILAKSCSFKN
jgi:hypothetical protein